MNETFIDVRELSEFTCGHIADAKSVPLGTLATASSTWDKTQLITLVCKGGRRAEQARLQLEASGFSSLSVLPGGMDAWRAAGNPVISTEHRPWSMERQVRTAASSLVVGTLALSIWVSHYFLLGTALVGAGLVFAGATDNCMMASLLGRLPWNRAAERSK